jgi:dipeptidyl-peptidase 4
MRTAVRALGLWTVLAVTLPAGARAQGAAAGVALGQLRTAAEQTGFARHTRHHELVEYFEAVQARSPEMRIGSFGRTFEGRDLPYAIFSRPGVVRAEEALQSGKPIVLLAANVHGGERTFRESLLVMLRDLATPGTELNGMLDDMVILVAPTLNPDGFEASERGQRGNAWGIDMNRDYIKLEMPEIAQYIGNLVNRWHPHIFVDGHNGGAYPYNVTYQCPSLAGADQAITALCDREIFPLIDRELEADGYRSFFYDTGTSPTRWTTGGFDARIGRNYGGLINSVGILFESPGGQTLETGVAAGVIAYRSVLRYVRDNPERLLSVVNGARAQTVALGERAEGLVPVRMRYEPEPYAVTYLYVEGRQPGRPVQTIRSDSLMKRPVATLERPRPWAYVLPREATEAVAMLRRHNIAVEVLREPTEVEVQAYTLTGVRYEQAYNHAAATVVETGEVVTVRRTFPAGSYLIRTGQVLGRLVTHMLEPETNDNVIYWNTMDAWLPKPALQGGVAAARGDEENGPPAQARTSEPPLIPIFKIMRATAVPTRLVQ